MHTKEFYPFLTKGILRKDFRKWKFRMDVSCLTLPDWYRSISFDGRDGRYNISDVFWVLIKILSKVKGKSWYRKTRTKTTPCPPLYSLSFKLLFKYEICHYKLTEIPMDNYIIDFVILNMKVFYIHIFRLIILWVDHSANPPPASGLKDLFFFISFISIHSKYYVRCLSKSP